MKFRLVILFMIGLLVIGALPAAAQDQTKGDDFAALNCLGLSNADCAIVQKAAENTHKIRSFTQSFDLSFNVSNASQLIKGFDTSISAQGSGPIVIDPSKMTRKEPYAGFSMALDASGTSTDSKGEKSGDVSLIIADGNLYLKDATTGDWRGTSLEDLSKNPRAMSFSFMGTDMSSDQMMQMGMAMGMMGAAANGQSNGTPMPMLNGLDPTKLLQTPGLLSQKRLADDTIDGQKMAVFALTADIGVLLSDKDVQKAFTDMASGMGDSDNPMAQQMSLMLPILLKGTTGTVTLTRWIGADDGLPHRVTLDGGASIDLGIKSGKGTPVPPIDLKLNFSVDLSKINDTTAPTAPADATIVPADEFLPTAEATPAQ